jgi:hypothetical protein
VVCTSPASQLRDVYFPEQIADDEDVQSELVAQIYVATRGVSCLRDHGHQAERVDASHLLTLAACARLSQGDAISAHQFASCAEVNQRDIGTNQNQLQAILVVDTKRRKNKRKSKKDHLLLLFYQEN